MARCSFCGRTFTSAQGVRAHLKACPAYRRTRPTHPAPRRNQRLTDEQLLDRLWASSGTSRQTPCASVSDVPEPRSVPRPGARPPATPPDEERRRQRQAREEAERRAEAGRQERATRIRALLQEIKFFAVDAHFQWPPVPAAALAEAKVAIERNLPTHPILELPRMEVQQIAGGIRDKVYDGYRTSAGSAPVQSTSLITSNPLPTQEVTMSKQRVLSGYFICPLCDEEFELDREPEKDAKCEDCGVPLEELEENEDNDDAD